MHSSDRRISVPPPPDRPARAPLGVAAARAVATAIRAESARIRAVSEETRGIALAARDYAVEIRRDWTGA